MSARIVVLGGGLCGLSAGLMLARDGHQVTVLERDDAPVPESAQLAWEQWRREGVKQFRQAHLLAPGGCAVLEGELADVHRALIGAGAVRFDALDLLPPTLPDPGPWPDGQRFVTFTARRPVFEQVLGRAAEQQDDLHVRRGADVAGLLAQTNGDAHVTGVRLRSGETLDADLVVDAMGRRSSLPQWLSEAGIGSVEEEAEDSGFIYYTRYFRSRDGSTPPVYAPPLSPIGTFSVLTIPSDNQTWSVTLYVSSGDQALKRMREVDAWTSVVKTCPAHAHWLEGEPIGEMVAMGGVVDRSRRPVRDGPEGGVGGRLITGLALLGDACACTNPSLGRGMTLGLMHAQALRRAVSAHLHDPHEFAQAWDDATEATLMPWYRETIIEDRARLGEIEALREGREPPPPSDPAAALMQALPVAMLHDGDVFRAFLESRCCLTRLSESLARDDMAERTLALAGEHELLPIPGPGREDLLALLA